jgi:hypothetical protein
MCRTSQSLWFYKSYNIFFLNCYTHKAPSNSLPKKDCLFCLCTSTVQQCVSAYIFTLLVISLFPVHFTLTTSNKQNISTNLHGEVKPPIHPNILLPLSLALSSAPNAEKNPWVPCTHFLTLILTGYSPVVISKQVSNILLNWIKKNIRWLTTHASEILGTATNYL